MLKSIHLLLSGTLVHGAGLEAFALFTAAIVGDAFTFTVGAEVDAFAFLLVLNLTPLHLLLVLELANLMFQDQV